MFVRTVRNKSGHTYLKFVESYREGDKVKQRICFNLGRLDVLQATHQLDTITAGLARVCQHLKVVDLTKDISVEDTYYYGSAYVTYELFQRVGLWEIFDQISRRHKKLKFPFAKVVFTMVMSRFIEPSSKLALKERWSERIYPDYVPVPMELHHIYRALDSLCDHKEEIQRALLYPKPQLSLLDQEALDLIFYDTTTLRFESTKTEGGQLRRFGYSKERRCDCTQVILGLLLKRDGLPVGYRLFPGNTYEGKTVPIILKKLKTELKIGRIIFVADRGMICSKNIDGILKCGLEFVMGIKLWAMKEEEQDRVLKECHFDQDTETFQVAELPHPHGRLIITWSPERAKRDQHSRDDILEKLRLQLSRSDNTENLISHRAYKKYLKVVEAGRVSLNTDAIEAERRRDGLFGILTNVASHELSALDILERYKELWRIEDAFGEIKGTLQTRPMFHWTDNRIEGHVMVCFLSYYLEALTTKILREQKQPFSAVSAFDALNQIRAVPVKVREHVVWLRTQMNPIATQTLKSLKLKIPTEVIKLS